MNFHFEEDPVNKINIINSLEQIPSSEADNHLAGQEVIQLLWKSKVHYYAQNPIHNLTLYSFMIHLNIILTLMPKSPKQALPIKSSDILLAFLTALMHATWPTYPFFDTFNEDYNLQ